MLIKDKNNYKKDLISYLANKYFTDKGTDFGSDPHCYSVLYDNFFKEIQNENIRILEMGIGDRDPSIGASLKIWGDYFPNAEIVGLDFNKDVLHIFEVNNKNNRISVHWCDQSNKDSLNNIVNIYKDNKFDIIIDDGSHQNNHIIMSFEVFFSKLLKNEGIYVVEDLYGSYVDNNRNTAIEYFKKLIDEKIYGYNKFQANITKTTNDIDLQSIYFYRNICFFFKNKDMITG